MRSRALDRDATWYCSDCLETMPKPQVCRGCGLLEHQQWAKREVDVLTAHQVASLDELPKVLKEKARKRVLKFSDDQLRACLAQGHDVRAIALELGVSKGAIYARMYKLSIGVYGE